MGFTVINLTVLTGLKIALRLANAVSRTHLLSRSTPAPAQRTRAEARNTSIRPLCFTHATALGLDVLFQKTRTTWLCAQQQYPTKLVKYAKLFQRLYTCQHVTNCYKMT